MNTAPATRRRAGAKVIHAIGIFGSVKALLILCGLVRNKIIATVVGPAGLGLVMLYNSIIELVSQGTRLSIDQSAQRDISRNLGNARRLSLTVTVVHRWTLWLGALSVVLMCALSPLLSRWSWGTASRWYIYCILSPVPALITWGAMSVTINQGLRRFKAVARIQLFGGVAGIAAAVPLILWLGLDSIVWIIVAYGVATAAGGWIWRARVPRAPADNATVRRHGLGFVRLGILITASYAVSQVTSYIFVLYLNHTGTTTALGMYQAGYTLVNTYVAVILTGVWIEYYPRLSAMAHSPRRLQTALNHETAVALWVLMPVLCIFIALDQWVVRLVYAPGFGAVVPYVTLAAAGVTLRAVSWCQAYIILAKGDGHTYIVTETVSSLLILGLNIAGYRLWGFTGLGVSYIGGYGAYTAMTTLVCRRRYGVRLNAGVTRLAVLAVTVCLGAAVMHRCGWWWGAAAAGSATVPFAARRLWRMYRR